MTSESLWKCQALFRDTILAEWNVGRVERDSDAGVIRVLTHGRGSGDPGPGEQLGGNVLSLRENRIPRKGCRLFSRLFFFFALSLIKHLKCKCCFLFVLLARKESGFLCPSLAGY